MVQTFRFLVLNDDPDLRFLQRHALQKAFAGCQVHEAVTCEEALGIASRSEHDAVIADNQLQGTSGAECIATLRGMGVTCPLIIVTSSEDPKVHRAALASGADRVFPPAHPDYIGFLRSTLRPTH